MRSRSHVIAFQPSDIAALGSTGTEFGAGFPPVQQRCAGRRVIFAFEAIEWHSGQN
jgi:hypothetical protein